MEEHQGYQAIESFSTWFYDHVFSYHTSTIAEFLNEIRWAIYEYLYPVFRECFRQKHGDIAYSYVIPPEIEQPLARAMRSEEHTSELQSLMRISYAVFCLKKKKIIIQHRYTT